MFIFSGEGRGAGQVALRGDERAGASLTLLHCRVYVTPVDGLFRFTSRA